MTRHDILARAVMAAALALIWVLLINDFSLGTILFGLILGALVPLLTRPFWPQAPRIRRFDRLLFYILLALGDIVVANLQVAYLILFKRNRDLQPAFIAVPLELRAPEAIAVLAGTITLTPGTVSCDLSADGHSLLVHGLNVTDEKAAVAEIKRRYEVRLLEIFG